MSKSTKAHFEKAQKHILGNKESTFLKKTIKCALDDTKDIIELLKEHKSNLQKIKIELMEYRANENDKVKSNRIIQIETAITQEINILGNII